MAEAEYAGQGGEGVVEGCRGAGVLLMVSMPDYTVEWPCRDGRMQVCELFDVDTRACIVDGALFCTARYQISSGILLDESMLVFVHRWDRCDTTPSFTVKCMDMTQRILTASWISFVRPVVETKGIP